MKGAEVPEIFVDADGCPVKEEIYRVARRYKLSVTLVANTWMRIPETGWLKQVVVEGQVNAADDWIAEHAGKNDIVITGDIPLAARCLAKGAAVLDLRGGVFTETGIGQALAGRELMARLREAGTITGGPAAFEERDRSRFLQRLDETVHAVRRQAGR
jgi:uncharacterized protein YaiI (UPF0178 family)